MIVFIKNLISLLFFKYYKKNEVLYDENLYSEHIFILYQGNFLLEKLINNKIISTKAVDINFSNKQNWKILMAAMLY